MTPRGASKKKFGSRIFIALALAAMTVAAIANTTKPPSVEKSRSFSLKPIHTFETGHGVNCIAFTPDGSRLISGSWSELWDEFEVRYSSGGNVSFWDVRSGKRISQRRTMVPLLSVAYSSNGRLLATGYAGGLLKLSDADTGKTLRQVHLESDGIEAIAFSPDGMTLACGTFSSGECTSGPGPLYFVDPQTGQRRGKAYNGFFGRLNRDWERVWFTVSPESNQLILPSNNITVWRPTKSKAPIHLGQADAEVCASRGRMVAALLHDGKLELWDTVNRKMVAGANNAVSEGNYRHIAISSNGQYVAVSGDGQIRIWRIISSTQQQKLP